ncbi:MAG: hypothetical protein EZS28_044463 [Streblomastix strix]|uniref:Uncharacterized protein n=1 Tax=Streblomastix strix TaxID=222440 RepID=A0A5J4TQ21_9EUKA|nr:MAG: hypothetical protein EZS28_044463 [Streblomastix strix]
MIQDNPTKRNYTAYSNGIRIGNNSGDSSSSLYLGCATTAIDTTQAGQWEISKTNDKELTITPSSLRQDDHSVGSSDSFAGVTAGNMQINPNELSYGEGIRIANSPIANVSAIYIGTSTSSSGEIDGQWTIIKRSTGELYICRTADQNIVNRGLAISADGNTLSFNGSVIAGTGASNGASNGSVQYSAGNPILWGENSTGTEGGFYSNGTNICWRARPITLGSVPP